MINKKLKLELNNLSELRFSKGCKLFKNVKFIFNSKLFFKDYKMNL